MTSKIKSTIKKFNYIEIKNVIKMKIIENKPSTSHWYTLNMNESRTFKSLEKRLFDLTLTKDLKKDYYKYFPSLKLLIEIRDINSQISYLKNKKTKQFDL